MATSSQAFSKSRNSIWVLPWNNRQILYLGVSITLCVVNLLLPIERGFPVVRIAGYPLTLPILASIVTAGLLWVESGGRFPGWRVNRYVVLQLLVVAALAISALVAVDIIAGLFVALNYFTTFVLNFFILDYLFRRGFRYSFAVVLSFIALIAAIVGILEGLFRYYLPFYRDIFLGYDFEQMSYAMTRSDFRALGTLGNPILYSVALCLAMPFAMELKNRLARYVIIGALLGASVFAISLTSVALLLALLVGFVVVSRNNIRLFVQLSLVALALFLVVVQANPRKDDLITLWSAKFSTDNANAQTRLDMVNWALERFADTGYRFQMLVGDGLKSTTQALSEAGFVEKATLDNIYLNLLLETGLLGLSAYLLMALIMILQFRRAASKSLHWYTWIGFFVIGMSFEMIFYATFPFVWVASTAALVYDTQQWKNLRILSRGPSLH